MTRKRAERLLLTGTGLLTVTAWLGWRSATPELQATVAPRAPAVPSDSAVTDSALAEAEELTVNSDPFRLSNTPPLARFDPTGDGSGQNTQRAAPPPLRPTFALKAIVGGPPWQAVIDGIPGQPTGTVIRPGARYDKLFIRSVTRDSVVIQGPDTSWVLTFAKRS